ncbi:hypothetical protein EHI8A_072800 [Entamoeba histolytica HM-1:IMSS-B]|uniref:Uncharacterized protein n=5 Tax=Entamoeba TaxID=5758 RepID=C4M3U8_ENTH1|nr:hypothetical protein ENU1_148850 [Entamoeba nuttalli P19]XP_653728.1 hypothetical protein EHI_163680 [Entamoeba histolytica HM-1:IMSS]EMH73518.1 hypothetical protein EHI8A_072800 [Entamoeba histolytica HM-1:IMSS-B]ENY65854.1 hypothetical protein EHI7A_071450 [Entamoeba histolytica HM-1:IMSS-A]GAT96013.1 hypothetical protein CL6EHI_163680 [Entamoeba histolytica]EAL48340.1 hypothetical protein EHI_163680 [Entamoeba histolytica HM-1:IMSS]EKE38892.1 hypothetical protein ENU1_148850 [Entamoeba |eukprot:XP_008858779.1 hypothetical protein ENU1_148850 [Entamoeba nuttalli P19]
MKYALENDKKWKMTEDWKNFEHKYDSLKLNMKKVPFIDNDNTKTMEEFIHETEQNMKPIHEDKRHSEEKKPIQKKENNKDSKKEAKKPNVKKEFKKSKETNNDKKK